MRTEEYIPQKIEEVNCMMCGSDSYRLHERFGNNYQYSYVECSNCSNIYLNPRPVYNSDFTDAAYDQYGSTCEIMNSGDKNCDTAINIIKGKETVFQQIEGSYGKKGKILDLGCSTGGFMLAAEHFGWEPHGIDISRPMVEHVKNNLGFKAKVGQFEELDLSDWGKMDVIYCSHVIEHIPHPLVWMETFKKHLKPGGLLVLDIPNQHAPEKKLQRLFKKIGLRKNKWDPVRTPDHLYEPHQKSMKYLAEKTGFNVIEMFTYSGKPKKQDLKYNLFHHNLKWGSKIRMISKSV